MKKFLPFSRRQPSLDRFAVGRGGWAISDRPNGKSLRKVSATSLNTKSIQVVRGAYNIDLNKVDSSFTKLHRACLLNDETQVKKHIHKVDVNSHDSSKRYPIHLATVNGNLAILKLLIENGADPNVQDNEGNSPLIKSIECGHEHLVKYLVNSGADPNLSDLELNTALHWAIITESIIAIDVLIGLKKCDLNARNNRDETCLHLAVRCPLINSITFDMLVQAGSDLNVRDQLGLTPVDIAQACSNKLALSVFNRQQANKNNPEFSDTSDDQITVRKMCDDYKLKYITKNRENLEYEKRLIQLNSQLERLKLDMSFLKEQNEILKQDNERILSENSQFKLENSALREEVKTIKHLSDIRSTQQPTEADLVTNNSSNKEYNDHEDRNAYSTNYASKSFDEFVNNVSTLQERINKLKSGLTTMQL